MKRRDFLKTSVVAGVALSLNFEGLQAALSSNTVAVEQAPDLVAVMGGEPAVMLDKALEALGGIGKYIKKGQKVVIKPNIGWDRTPELAGNTNPEFFGGYTNTFNWRNWSLNALFTFSYGNDLMYQKDVTDMAMNSLQNRGIRVLEHYSAENTASSRPRYLFGGSQRMTDMSVYDASYLKLKSLTLSYDLPKHLCQKIKLNALSCICYGDQSLYHYEVSRARS